MYESYTELPVKAQVQRMFKKVELISIAEELGMETESLTARQLVVGIVNDLEQSGVPETGDCSDELFEFMLNADFIDEDGNLIEVSNGRKGGTDEVEEEEDDSDEISIPEELPPCYAFADSRDPACNRCVIFDMCHEERVLVRPECYGKLFDATSEECRGCLEAGPCRKVSS